MRFGKVVSNRDMRLPSSVCFSLVALILAGCATTPDARSMKLVVTGNAGTMVTVHYTADGVKQEETGVIPVTVRFHGRNAEWEIVRPSGGQEFRVDMYVGDMKRLSTTSSGHSKVRGQIEYSAAQEKYWMSPAD